MAKTDLEIAQECVMQPIQQVAQKVGISEAELEYYGRSEEHTSELQSPS